VFLLPAHELGGKAGTSARTAIGIEKNKKIEEGNSVGI
jgi:hypothetical protein